MCQAAILPSVIVGESAGRLQMVRFFRKLKINGFSCFTG